MLQCLIATYIDEIKQTLDSDSFLLMANYMCSAEAPARTEFLRLLRISEFFGFQWQNLAEILSLFKLYNNLGKVAVRVKLWLIIYCGHLVEWIVK